MDLVYGSVKGSGKCDQLEGDFRGWSDVGSHCESFDAVSPSFQVASHLLKQEEVRVSVRPQILRVKPHCVDT